MRSNKGKRTGSGIGGALGTVLGGFFGPLGSALGGAGGSAIGTGLGAIADGQEEETDRFNLPGSTAIAKDNATNVLRDLNESPGLSAGTVSRAQESMNRDALKGTQRLNTRLNMGGMSDLAKERMVRGFEDNFTKLSVELDEKLIDEGIRQERANIDSKAKAGSSLAQIGQQETALDLQNAREEDARKQETANMFKGALTQAAGATGLDFKMPDFLKNLGGGVEDLGTDAEINAMPTLPDSNYTPYQADNSVMEDESLLDGTFAELEKQMAAFDKADEVNFESQFDDNDYGEMGLSLIDDTIDGLGGKYDSDAGFLNDVETKTYTGGEGDEYLVYGDIFKDIINGRKKMRLTNDQKKRMKELGLSTQKKDMRKNIEKIDAITEEQRTKQSILDDLDKEMVNMTDQGFFGGAQ